MFGEGNFIVDDNGTVEISPGQEEALLNHLVGFFMGGGSIGSLGGGDMGGPGTTLAAAYFYSFQIYDAITGADDNSYSVALYHGKMTFGSYKHPTSYVTYANGIPDGSNDQPGWFTRIADWMDNLMHDNNESMPDKHFTDHGGVEAVGKTHGENQETRVSTRNDIIRYNVDWLLNMSDAYTPDIFPNLKLPFFAEYMDNMTDNINAVNAAMEINKESHPDFNTQIIRNQDGSINHMVISHDADTNGFSQYSDHMIDSLLQ